MNDKQQTEQLKEALNKYARAYGKSFETAYGIYTEARTLIDFGMLPLLLPENAVVLTQEQYDHMFSFKSTRGGFFNILDTVREVQSQDTAKDFIFKVESYLGYNDDNDAFTKKELLLILAEVAKEQYGVEMK